MQRSARASHGAHAAPAAPHEAAVCVAYGTHVLPLQQPFGHELALHTHVPLEQVWPLPHGAPAPHRHWPDAHVFVDPEHGPQAAPPVPHAAALCEPC